MKKFLSLILALLLLFGMFPKVPLVASAAGTDVIRNDAKGIPDKTVFLTVAVVPEIVAI